MKEHWRFGDNPWSADGYRQHFGEQREAEELIDREAIPELIDQFRRGIILGKLQEISESVALIADRLGQIDTAVGTVVPIQHLADDSLTLVRPILALVEDTGGNFLSSFADCNINASGDTRFEAVENLKDLMVATFKRLAKSPSERLGPVPTRQLEVLRAFIRVED